jgi:hypothetical protein
MCRKETNVRKGRRGDEQHNRGNLNHMQKGDGRGKGFLGRHCMGEWQLIYDLINL